MKLLSLSVDGCRCFRNKIELKDLDEKINVVYGQNETGKSTLIDAMARAFFDSHTSRAREIKNMRPWDTTMTPEISVEFIDDQQRRLLLKKRFLNEPYARLFQWEENKYNPLAEGIEAEEVVRNIMGSNFTGESASTREDWGLARLLWFPQDQKRFEKPVLKGTFGQRLREMLDVMRIGDREQILIEDINSTCDQFFDQKTGEFRQDSSVNRLRAKIEELEDELQEVNQHLKEAKEASQKRDLLYNELSSIEEELNFEEEKLAKVEGDAAQVQEKREKVKQKKEKLRQLEEVYNILVEDLRLVEKKNENLETERRNLAELKEQYASQLERLDTLKQEREDIRRELSDNEEQLQQLKRKQQEAQNLEQAVLLREEINELENNINKIEQLKRELSAKQSQLKKLIVPVDQDIDEAEELNQKINHLQIELEAMAVSVLVTAESDIELYYNGDNENRIALDEESKFEINASDKTLVNIPGVAGIEVNCGSGDAGEKKQQLRNLKNNFRTLLSYYGVKDIEALYGQKIQADDLQAEIESIEDEINDLVGNEESKSALESKLQVMRSRLNNLLSEQGISQYELTEIEEHNEKQLLKEISKYESSISSINHRLNELQNDIESKLQKSSQLKLKIVKTEQRIEYLQESKGHILSRYDDELDNLEWELQQKEQELMLHEQQLENIQKQLSEDREEPEMEQETVENNLKQNRKRKEEVKEELARIEERLKIAAEKGWYSKRNKLQEEIALINKQLEEQQEKARAFSLLKSFFVYRKKVGREKIARPLERIVTRKLSSVRQSKDTRVMFSDNLKLDQMEVGQELIVSPDEFSAGTREQLYIITRLTAGEIIAGEQKQLVVLDDALVFTDPHRHGRMLDLIAEASQKLQIIILTSHLDRFKWLPGKKYNLSMLASSE